jgi:riboflavin kinase/FMN adenylyltransferase
VIPGARAIADPLSGSVVTLGAFDGVHRGHQALIHRAVECAKALGVEAVAYTFDPHPAKVLAPKVAPRMLIPLRERIRLIEKLGIDRVIVEPFDPAFAELTADAWVEGYLAEKLRPKVVIVGFNFSYGRGRGGNPDHLRRSGERLGFSVEVVEPVVVSTMVVSSTRIREFLLEGNVSGARLLLGRPFALTGPVIKGEGRGHRIGVPTANLQPENELIPEHGVYATRVVIDPDGAGAQETLLPAVTNIGLRPTFAGSTVSVESHLLDYEGELYGRRLRVELIEHLRDERRFDGVEALVRQIHEDIERARHVLSYAEDAAVP